jgi:hypothetical protein
MSGKKKKRLLAHYTIAAIERNVTIRLWFRVIEGLDIIRRLRRFTEGCLVVFVSPFFEKKICVICG